MPITIFINNIGTAKATDVSVTLRFPEKLRIFDIEEIIELEEPKTPKKPDNPISVAERKAKSERARALDLAFPDFTAPYKDIDYQALFADPLRRGNTIYESIEIKDNTVEIEQKRGIVHSKTDWFSGCYLVPDVPGEYEVNVTLMCAEYKAPEETAIRFVVESYV